MRIDPSVTLRPDLGTIAYEYVADAARQGFVAQRVLPKFPTTNRSGQYPELEPKVFLEMANLARAPRSAYKRGDWSATWKNYDCAEYGYEEPLDDVEATMVRSYFDAEAVCVQRATLMILRAQEKRVADLLTNTSTFTNSAATTAWTTPATADPLADVNRAKSAIKLATGIEPDTIVLTDKAYRAVCNCASVLDRVKYTNPAVVRGDLTEDILKTYFGVSNIFVAGAVYNQNGRNKTESIARIWTDAKVFVCKLSGSGSDLKEPGLGRTFVWEPDSPDIVTVEQYREEATRSTIYRVRQHVCEKIQLAAAGYILTGCVA